MKKLASSILSISAGGISLLSLLLPYLIEYSDSSLTSTETNSAIGMIARFEGWIGFEAPVYILSIIAVIGIAIALIVLGALTLKRSEEKCSKMYLLQRVGIIVLTALELIAMVCLFSYGNGSWWVVSVGIGAWSCLVNLVAICILNFVLCKNKNK